jgi:toxin HigB-1
MIGSFWEEELAKFFRSEGKYHTKLVPTELKRIVYRKLLALEQAQDRRDLEKIAGNRLEKLDNKRTNQYSIRINKQYRLVFFIVANQF